MGHESLRALRVLMRGIRLLDRVDLFQRGIPALFQCCGDQAIGGVHFFLPPLRKVRFILRALNLQVPLPVDGGRALREFFLRLQRDRQLGGLEHLQHSL